MGSDAECEISFSDSHILSSVAHVTATVQCSLQANYPPSQAYVQKQWTCQKPNNHQCTTESPCGENEGDCGVDADCASGLVCGTSNCPKRKSKHDPCGDEKDEDKGDEDKGDED